MAEVVQALGRGGQRLAESALGWNRKTIRKGAQEVTTGQPILDRFQDRGRKKFEEHLPLLPGHIRAIVVKPVETLETRFGNPGQTSSETRAISGARPLGFRSSTPLRAPVQNADTRAASQAGATNRPGPNTATPRRSSLHYASRHPPEVRAPSTPSEPDSSWRRSTHLRSIRRR